MHARLTPGMASGPKCPWPGTRFIKDRVKGSYMRCGPMKQVALLVEPCARQANTG